MDFRNRSNQILRSEAYTMRILWEYIFSAIPTLEDYATNRGRKKIELNVNVDDLLENLKKFAPKQNGDGVSELPKRQWIEAALEMFVKIKLAKRNGKDKYIIYYHNLKSGKILDNFIPKVVKIKNQRLL